MRSRTSDLEQGDRGDRFYLVESGRAEVVRDGCLINALRQGAGCGEVALLGDTPRTASVRVSANAHLLVTILDRPAFLTAVTGHQVGAAAGQDVVAQPQARVAAKHPAATEDYGDPLAET